MGPTQKAAKNLSDSPWQKLYDAMAQAQKDGDLAKFRIEVSLILINLPQENKELAMPFRVEASLAISNFSQPKKFAEQMEQVLGRLGKQHVKRESEFLPGEKSGQTMLIYNGMSIQMDGPYQKQARLVADVLAEINALLPEGSGVQRVEIAEGFSSDREGYLGHVVRIPSLYMDREEDLLLFAFHEAAHCLLEQGVSEKRKKELASLWKELVGTLDMVLPGFGWKDGNVKSYDAATENMDDAEFERLENHPLIRLFDESGYVDSDRDAGHPYDDYEELFASASNVMRNFPDEFAKRLGELKAGSPQQYQLAVKVASAVLFAWSDWSTEGASLFGKKLRDELGQ